MLQTSTYIRVRYGDTDRMGYVYYGCYPYYFEIGRTEMLREIGVAYTQLEAQGIMLPVTELHAQYLAPAYYDDLLRLNTYIKEMPKVKIRFDYELLNPHNERIHKGYTILAFVDIQSNKPTKIPEFLKTALQPYL